MSGNFSVPTSYPGDGNQTGSEELSANLSLTEENNTAISEGHPQSTRASLLNTLLTKTIEITTQKALPAVMDTLSEVTAAGNVATEVTSPGGEVTPQPGSLTTSTTTAPVPANYSINPTSNSTIWQALTTAATSATSEIYDSLTGNTTDYYNYDDYDDGSDEDYVVPVVKHTHPHVHYNKTFWRGEVDHHMVNMDYDQEHVEHYNDVIYVIVVVIFYGAVLVLAFVIQMRRRNHYTDIDSEHFSEYLHMKWDVLEKKRLLGKERVGKMRCLVDAPNVAFIPEQSV